MAAKPLTKAQAAALATVNSRQTYEYEINARTVRILVKGGYLRRDLGKDYNSIWILCLTEQGRAALAEHQKAALLAHYRDGDVKRLVEVAAKQIEQENDNVHPTGS